MNQELTTARDEILIVDDDPGVLAALETLLSDTHEIHTAESGEVAWSILQQEDIDIALVDLSLPDFDGLELLTRLRQQDYATEVIMITGHGTISSAVEAMRIGAYDYLTKPVDSIRLKQVIAKAAEKHRLFISNRAMARQLQELTRYEELIGQSEPMRKVYQTIETVAKSDATVLISGESGTGKELVARAIHRRSRRHKAPFVATNCSALPAEILENELFGHEKGAFTGALDEKPGCFELAHAGTLFFDEIGDMPYDLQAKLLRALEERRFRRLGGRKEISVDVRIISATNRDIRTALREKTLREDLFYRLAVVEIELPPLRERLSDLSLLIEDFIKRFSEKNNKRIAGLSRDALEILSRYTWPGNVRELRNVIERAVIMATGRFLTATELPDHLRGVENMNELKVPIGTTIEEAERQLILRTLEFHQNNKTRAAETLGISLKTLHNKLVKYRSARSEAL